MTSVQIILILTLHLQVSYGSITIREQLLRDINRDLTLSSSPSHQCEPIKIDMCHRLGYNETIMPNLVGHELQQDAEMQLVTFTPLIQYGCSSQLRFFLCSVYVPMCTDKVPTSSGWGLSIGPCRSLCETVKGKCLSVLQDFGFFWPSALNCSKFPPKNDHQHMCMEGPGEDDQWSSSSQNIAPKSSIDSVISSHVNDGDFKNSGKGSYPSFLTNGHTGPCSHLKHSSEYFYINRTDRCDHRCSADILFSRDNKDFVETWMWVWSVICFITTSITLVTFLTGWLSIVQTQSCPISERIILLIAASYFMYSLGILIRLLVGREGAACHVEITSSEHLTESDQQTVTVFITEGPDNVSCMVIFVLTYYFSTSAMIWWVNLSITWFLASGLNWSDSDITKKWSSVFHSIAWILPSILTLSVVGLRAVDSDELTALCSVGNHSSGHLLIFVIIPSVTFLITGIIFIFLKMCCFRLTKTDQLTNRHSFSQSSVTSSSHHHQQLNLLNHHPNLQVNQQNLFHKQMDTRIGIFVIFFLVPSLTLLSGHIYQYFNRDSWYSISHPHSLPNVEFFILNIFMSLLIGIKAGCWIWSSLSWSSPTGSGRQQMRKVTTTGSVSRPPTSLSTVDYQSVQQVQPPSLTYSSYSGSTYYPYQTLLAPPPTPSIGSVVDPRQTSIYQSPALRSQTPQRMSGQRLRRGETTV